MLRTLVYEFNNSIVNASHYQELINQLVKLLLHDMSLHALTWELMEMI